MNSAFLLVTSAFFAAAEPIPAPISAPAAPIAAPAPHAAAPVISTGSACSGGNCGAEACCDTDCDPCCGKPGLFSRMRGMFAKKSCCEPCCEPICDSCAPTVTHSAPAAAPAAIPGGAIQGTPIPVAPPAEKIPAPKDETKPTGLKIGGGLYGSPAIAPAAPKAEAQGPSIPF